jgi:putative endonuclease
MGAGHITRRIVRFLDHLAPAAAKAAHLKTGARGEEAAYFHLRSLGYVMVARNYRTASRRGEIDLIGWDEQTLCFIEVKTRSKKDEMLPAELAVDRDKQDELKAMARAYMRRLDPKPPYRFDVVSVYCQGEKPEIKVIKSAFE